MESSKSMKSKKWLEYHQGNKFINAVKAKRKQNAFARDVSKKRGAQMLKNIDAVRRSLSEKIVQEKQAVERARKEEEHNAQMRASILEAIPKGRSYAYKR